MTSPARSDTHWANRYVGLPFRPLGRDQQGVDCYGLVWKVFLEQFDVRLPDYLGRYGQHLQANEVRNLFTMGLQEPIWSLVDRPRDGDVVVLQIQGHAYHVGIMVDRWRMLHARESATVAIERINSTMWRSRVLGYYRHRDLRS